jgi:hypothetical protein
MRTIEAVAAERGLTRISLLSSITAQGFYERLRYNVVRDIFHEPSGRSLWRNSSLSRLASLVCPADDIRSDDIA